MLKSISVSVVKRIVSLFHGEDAGSKIVMGYLVCGLHGFEIFLWLSAG